jgi:copper chaperone CopZ
MKKLLTIASTIVIAWCAQADTSVKLSKVHLCCASCVKGIDKAVSTTPGATAQSDKDAGTVTITTSDQATAQKAVNAIVAAGYFGTCSDPNIKVKDESGAKKGKVQKVKISGVHLCCGKCVTSVNDALLKVKGVKATTAAKGIDSFDVTGDFKPKAVIKGLNEAGFAGTVAK